MTEIDTLLSGGLVFDGSGRPPQRADIAIKGDRIVAVAEPGTLRAALEIDIGGYAAAPGFIDVHTHDDRAALSAAAMLPKLTQGVTTVVTGNCGISLAPLISDAVVPPLDIIAEEGSLRYPRFADYLDDLEGRGTAVNVMALIGHTTLRLGAMDDLARPATAAERARMRDQVDDAMRAGAWGLSTGAFYPPARSAPTDEIIAVAEPLTRHKGIYATHMRNEAEQVIESLEETFLIGRSLGVRVLISHHKLAGIANHGRSTETLALIEEAMRHQRVSLDCYPYNASSTMLHPDLIERASKVLVSWSDPHPEFRGRELADVAAQMGCDQKTAAQRLMPAGAIYFVMDEADVQRILAFEHTMIGSDGLPHDAHPHPRLWGTFPRVLGHYSRDENLFPMEEAIRRMTGLPASQFGIVDRGLLRPGAFADIAVFDPATIASPATFEHPARPALGMKQVYVNGLPALESTDSPPLHGRVLRGPGSTRP